ncbi:unnamed protein product [Thlaspi arvense]|uniref:MI domain-containing protein n=1 Tax=Thlaspi arvense TaxID=13288 RepID=A0AAU9SXR7_THLAR|nr:unnamed protein product [Thlaspi arvense]
MTESVAGPAKLENSRRDKRKEARLQKNQKKHEYFQRQKLRKEKRGSSSVQKTGDVIKPENVHQESDSETEHDVKSVRSLTHEKGEDRVKSKEKKMQRVDRVKDVKKPKKTKFEELLEMETQSGLVSRDEDVELERKLAKKLKVNKGKLRGLDDGMNELFEGLPSVLDSIGSELGDSSRKKRKRKRSEEKQDDEVVDKQADEDLEHEESGFSDEAVVMQADEDSEHEDSDHSDEVVDKQADEDLEHEESDFSDEASEEEPTRKRDRKQRKKKNKKKKSVDEELESHPMEITDRGESETVSSDDSPSALEKVESPLQEDPQSTIKYVAPRFRSQARSEPEEHTKLRTRIKGLLNKMAESNVETITAELSTIYRTVARSVSSQIFCEEVLATYSRGNEQYSVFAAFIAGMACQVGMDFSAKLIASLAKSFEDEYQKEDSLSLNGITLLLSYLCMLGVCSSDLIYDFFMTLGTRLTEVAASTIITVLDCCGMKIRSDDPLAMKTFIISIQNKTNEIKTSPEGQPKIKNYTMEKMLETLSAIKNNKFRAKDDSVQNTRVKKWLQKLRVEEVLLRGLTWSKLLDPEKKGQWWLSGDLVVKSNNAEDVAQTMDADVVEAQKMLKLADAQRMNTDSRKAIFCVIMSSEDYIDAFEKLLRLDLPGKQDREIMRVLVECCLQEQVFNKYYTVLASKLCAHDKNHKFTLQYCIWDHFKELETMSLQRSMHLAKFVAEMIVSFNLSLAVLKSVDLANPVMLTPKRIMHFRIMFEAIFEHPENLVWNLFTRIALNPDYEALRDGIKFFMKEYVVKANKAIFGKFRKAKEALNNADGLLM